MVDTQHAWSLTPASHMPASMPLHVDSAAMMSASSLLGSQASACCFVPIVKLFLYFKMCFGALEPPLTRARQMSASILVHEAVVMCLDASASAAAASAPPKETFGQTLDHLDFCARKASSA